MLLTETVDRVSGEILPMGPALPKPVGAVWFHGVTRGKEVDGEALRDSTSGTFHDGRFFIAELGRDSKSFPGCDPSLALSLSLSLSLSLFVALSLSLPPSFSLTLSLSLYLSLLLSPLSVSSLCQGR